MGYQVRLHTGETDSVADAYGLEGPLTFFQTRPGRTTIDSCARKVASYRTADIVRIRHDNPAHEALAS